MAVRNSPGPGPGRVRLQLRVCVLAEGGQQRLDELAAEKAAAQGVGAGRCGASKEEVGDRRDDDGDAGAEDEGHVARPRAPGRGGPGERLEAAGHDEVGGGRREDARAGEERAEAHRQEQALLGTARKQVRAAEGGGGAHDGLACDGREQEDAHDAGRHGDDGDGRHDGDGDVQAEDRGPRGPCSCRRPGTADDEAGNASGEVAVLDGGAEHHAGKDEPRCLVRSGGEGGAEREQPGDDEDEEDGGAGVRRGRDLRRPRDRRCGARREHAARRPAQHGDGQQRARQQNHRRPRQRGLHAAHACGRDQGGRGGRGGRAGAGG